MIEFQTRAEHETKLLNTANGHIQWMKRFGFEKQTSQHFYDLQAEMLHQLMNRDAQPEY